MHWAVPDSSELQRIIALPRRVLGEVPDQTEKYARPGGKYRLRPIQSAALLEIEQCRGGFLIIGVGHGKTIISFLAANALKSERTVVLVPPTLRAQATRDLAHLSEHFHIPEIHIVAYSDLSNQRYADILERINPTLVVADEAHNLKRRQSARTMRFIRFFRKHQDCRFVALSGTMTSKSLKDYWHIAEIALRGQSPVPQHTGVLEDWCAALDPSPYPMHPGALLKLCKEGENVRDGYRRRLRESYGVVGTDESAIGTSLIISSRRPKVPQVVTDALKELRKTWSIGDEEFSEAIEYYRACRQVANGFYLRWDWPGDVVDVEWLECRRNWNRAVRAYLSRHSKPGMDSAGLLEEAAKSGQWDCPDWAPWSAVKHRPKPPTVAVWLDDFIVRESVKWGEGGGIIWFDQVELGHAIAKMGGFPYFGDGAKTAERILAATPEIFPTIVCSVKACKEGKNGLQRWHRNLYACMPNGADFEQSLGRTHRPGQEADEVTAEVYMHTSELKKGWEQALRDAEYIEGTLKTPQKLNFCTKLI